MSEEYEGWMVTNRRPNYDTETDYGQQIWHYCTKDRNWIYLSNARQCNWCKEEAPQGILDAALLAGVTAETSWEEEEEAE